MVVAAARTRCHSNRDSHQAVPGSGVDGTPATHQLRRHTPPRQPCPGCPRDSLPGHGAEAVVLRGHSFYKCDKTRAR